MRRLLVRRFESSFGAFAKSLENFLSVHEKAKRFIAKTGKFILDRKLLEQIYNADDDEIAEKLAEYESMLDSEVLPKNNKIYDVDGFARMDGFLNAITRVIQRVGRINRIGRRVFRRLYIFNFFPTEEGASIAKSREIASAKMFMIHNTIGEDAKIFDLDETPTQSGLYSKIVSNPESGEEECFFTRVKEEYREAMAKSPGNCLCF